MEYNNKGEEIVVEAFQRVYMNDSTEMGVSHTNIKPDLWMYITEMEKVPLVEAQGRILAEELSSTVNVPPADNSAMDGYAVHSTDLAD